MKGKEQSRAHLWWRVQAFLQGTVVVAAKSVIKGGVCHAKISFWLEGKWIKESLMAAACANTTLLLCAWRAGELLLFSIAISRLNKMQHILQKKKVEKAFQSPSQIWLPVAINWNILMYIENSLLRWQWHLQSSLPFPHSKNFFSGVSFV